MADLPLVQSSGVGTRALSLGNSFVALADDFTAIYWNPAGLAFLPVREFQLSLDYLDKRENSKLSIYDAAIEEKRFRFGHFGLIRSLPTSQGGFSLAFGLTRPILFDNCYSFKGWDQYQGTEPVTSPYFTIVHDTSGSTVVNDTILDILHSGEWLYFNQAKNRVYGQLNMLSAAAGWQIAPGLGFGFTLSLLFGKEYQNIRYQTYSYDPAQPDTISLFEDSKETIDRVFIGYDVRTGLLYKPISWLALGLTLVLPQRIQLDEKYHYKEMYYKTYVENWHDQGFMRSPFQGFLGVVLRFPYFISSSQFNFRAPLDGAVEMSERSYWKLGGASGIEIPIPVLATSLRCGYAWHELATHPYEIEYDEDPSPRTELRRTLDRGGHRFSLGASYLIKNAAALEFAYSYFTQTYSIRDPDWLNAIQEQHSWHRIQASFSIHY